MYHMSSTSSMTAGPATNTLQLMRQLSMREKKRVIVIAPKVKKICTKTEYFCLFLSPTTSPKKKKHMFMAASQPHPLRKSPTATIQMLTLAATMIVPNVHIPQETTIDDFLPKLSEKKEITMYPTNAPKQVQLDTRSTVTDLWHKYSPSVANEVKSESSGSTNDIHWSSGNSHTQSVQRESEMRSPWALQSKEQLRKRKAVLRRMMPVTNQQIRKMTTITNWYFPPSPMRSTRWKYVVGGWMPLSAFIILLLSSRTDINKSILQQDITSTHHHISLLSTSQLQNIMNPINQKKERRRFQLQHKEELLHLKRMLFLEQAKKQYLQSGIQNILTNLSASELMALYQQVCDAATPHSDTLLKRAE